MTPPPATELVDRKTRTRASSPAPAAKREPAAADAAKTEKGTKTGLLEGFGGTVGGSFFHAPRWVDVQKPPGTTSQESEVRKNPSLRKYLTGGFVFFSPNLVWLSIALLDYFVFPYDLEAAKTWRLHWMAHRFLSNSVIVFGYVGFWHVTLYLLAWGKRPFNPARSYQVQKVAHNMFYTMLGVLQWTVWEAVFMHCYATGRLPYVTDEESFGTTAGLLMFVATWFWVALWRDLHFYFAHRFIHIKFLYKYVHSLHHRNTDIEPFAGLCMHPIEHLFYFACAGPALYVKVSPFALMWFGIHLLISPAAAHSGFEDNWQSDQFHYLHHRFFECNYGTNGIPYDLWFGTFRESLDTSSKTYKGEHVESKEVKLDAKSAALADAKATLLGRPKWDEAVFNAVTYIGFPLLVCNAVEGALSGRQLGPLGDARLCGLAMAAGPLVVGAALLAATSRRPLANPRLTFLYPFHKERWFGPAGLNIAISLAVTALPVYHLVHMLVSEPGQGVYFALYGK